jgi:phosphoribosylcarboxyaminoimidazole (NCAIR) mutase
MALVRLVLGSKTDAENANKILAIWKEIGLSYKVSSASCHRHGGGDFAKFVLSIKEPFIAFIGGMSLAAPGLIEVVKKKALQARYIVFAIPTDKAARSAVEDLPAITAIITSGLNTVSLSHSLKNSAVAIAKLCFLVSEDESIIDGLFKLYKKEELDKPLEEEIELVDGLIPIKKKEKK